VGTGFRWIGTRGPQLGSSSIELDGTAVGTGSQNNARQSGLQRCVRVAAGGISNCKYYFSRCALLGLLDCLSDRLFVTAAEKDKLLNTLKSLEAGYGGSDLYQCLEKAVDILHGSYTGEGKFIFLRI
jgi:hypothetical protein